MKIISGDLLALANDGKFDLIIHGCNCQCVMGKGIAKSIRARFPEAYDADSQTAKGDRSKLGTISHAEILIEGRKLIVVNAYTQFDYRGGGVRVDYEAIKSAFESVREQFSGMRIGYPKIGAGLAGGDWNRVSRIIDTILDGEDHTLVEFA